MKDTDFSVIHSVMPQATLIDFPGRMSALMFTSGCNFHCGFCHNYQTMNDFRAKTYTFGELKDFCRKIKKQWTNAITITGGEPTLHPDLPETIKFLREQGFVIKLDTNGSNPEMLDKLLPDLGYVAMDIKCPLERYEDLVHYADVDKIRESIQLIMSKAADYEFRTTFVETYFMPEDIHDCGKTVLGAKRYTVQAFVPHDDLPDPGLRLLPRTRPSRLEEAATILKAYVQEVVVHGANVINSAH